MILAQILAIVLALAVLGNRLARKQERPARLLASLLAAGVGIVVGLVATSCLSAPYSPWDMVRLAAPMAAMRGFPLYTGRDSGVVLSTMYGPLGMLAFAPATLIPSPALAAIFGRMLAFLFTFGPLAAACILGGRSSSRMWRYTILLAATLAMISHESLRYSTTFLHADAPALGWLGLATLCAGSPRKGATLASGFACVFAMATKQTLLPLPVALLVATAMIHGREAALRWTFSFLIAATVVGLILLFTIDLGDCYLNIVSIPAGVPWKGRMPWNLLETTGEFLIHAAPLLFAGIMLAPRWTLGDGLATRLSRTFLIVSMAMIPMAILGRVKQAGDLNSFSSALYPLLLAITARAAASECVFKRAGRSAVIAGLAAMLILATIRLDREVGVLAKSRPFDVDCLYLREHPGELYLPWNPSAHLAVEGRATHHLFTAWERCEAGFPVTKAHLLAEIPERCRYVAFPLKRLGPVAGFGSSFQMLERHGLRVDRDHPVRLAGLPDHECFAVTR